MDIHQFLKDLRKYGIANEIPNITDANANFLQDLIVKNKFKKALEIGTANGYSAICLCIALRQTKGKLISIEFSSNSHSQAKENVEKAGFKDICNLVNKNALEYIPMIPDNDFDFVFIDGMKRRTKDFFELVYPKIISGGIIVVDDVIKFKDKMIGFYEYLDSKKIKYEVIKIDSDDGVMKIVKR